MKNQDQRHRLVVWSLLVVGVAIALIAWPDSTRSPETEASSPAPVAETAARSAGPSLRPPSALAPELVTRTRFWKPGEEHDYGTVEDPFIRQPQDYGTDTPKILGNRISYHVYDLERVQDMVRRGGEVNSELAQVRGEPLRADEREQARAVIQRFFDDTVPDVDAVIAGELSRDAGYARIGSRRLRMDRDLRGALGLSEKQFLALWPHIGDRQRIRDQLRD